MTLLADCLEATLVEHGPQSGCALAREVGARKADVLRVLREDPRFSRSGKGRACVWMVGDVRWPDDFEVAEEALVRLVSQGRSRPEDALLRIVLAWSTSELSQVAA